MIKLRRQMILSASLFASTLVIAGCGSAVEERTYQIKPVASAIDQITDLLRQYREGQIPGSEVAELHLLVEKVRESSPSSASIIETAIEELKRDPSQASTISRRALSELAGE